VYKLSNENEIYVVKETILKKKKKKA
jgi:hypothetical protein